MQPNQAMPPPLGGAMQPNEVMPPPLGGGVRSYTGFLPISSRTVRLWTSPILLPGILIGLLGTSMLGIRGAILFILFWIVYTYSRTRKPLWIYAIAVLLAALITALLLNSPLWTAASDLLEAIRPGSSKATSPAALVFVREFLNGAIAGELATGLPVLAGLGIGLWLGRAAAVSTGRQRSRFLTHLAVRTPLDGLLVGMASAAGFLGVAQPAPWMAIANLLTGLSEQPDLAADQLAALTAGVLYGFEQMIFSALQGLAGPLAWAAISGYFIGLVGVHRSRWLLLIAIGWVSSAALYGLWTMAFSVQVYGPYIRGLAALLSFIYFLACLLKARELEARLADQAISSGQTLPPPLPDAAPGPPPVPDADSLSFDELVPIACRTTRIWTSPLLFPGIVTVLVCVWSYQAIDAPDDARSFTERLGAYLIFMLFWMVHAYAGYFGFRKPLLIYLVPMLLGGIIIVLSPLLWLVYWWPAVSWPIPPEAPFWSSFLHNFTGPGLCEEFSKAVPILIGLGIGLKLGDCAVGPDSSRRKRIRRAFAVRTPLEGMLMGVASAAGFIILETFFGYVPMTTAEVIKQTNVESAGLLAGLLLMIFRVMSEFGGHVAWTAIGGYFIGLVGMRPDTARLLPIVWVGLATLHGLWDSAAAVPSFSLLGGVYLVSFIYFIACLLKALQLEAQRSGVDLTEPAYQA